MGYVVEKWYGATLAILGGESDERRTCSGVYNVRCESHQVSAYRWIVCDEGVSSNRQAWFRAIYDKPLVISDSGRAADHRDFMLRILPDILD